MKIAIHQPEHLPWLGYFDKMAKVDLHVFLDNVQYRKNYFQNRNRIETGWLTVPVITRGHISSQIKDMRIDNTQPWQRKYWGKLSQCYSKCPHYKNHSDTIKSIVMSDYEFLVDINYAFIDFFKRCFAINTPTILASDLTVNGNKSDIILDICREMKANTYLSGLSGRKYLDLKKFQEAGIGIEFHDYPNGGEPLSSLDYIMMMKG